MGKMHSRITKSSTIIGNNLRKFLEAYLFYKYPYKDDHDSSLERLYKFFGGGRDRYSIDKSRKQ